LPKDSSESYFIQIADLAACVVSLYAVITQRVGHLPKRLPEIVNGDRVIQWMEMLKPALNVKAASDDEYGVKFHPAH
jgi:hypothetical protein